MRKVIRTTGVEETIPGKLSIAELLKMIDTGIFDSVLLPDGIHAMLLCDAGYAKALPVNEKATALYLKKCYPGAKHKILGDVVIVPDDDFAPVLEDMRHA